MIHGEFDERERKKSTEIWVGLVAEKRTTSAAAPGASEPAAREKTRAGAVDRSSTKRARDSTFVATNASTRTGSAVSRPVTPNGASANSSAFSSAWWGAWSVAMQSTVPSRSPSTSALRSSSDRSGGFILKRVSYPERTTSSSTSVRWCGVTSQVTFTPEARACRIAARLPAVDTWAT